MSELHAVVFQHIEAVNTHDTEAIMATFVNDSVVNDNHHEYRGSEQIPGWLEREITGHKVTMTIVSSSRHYDGAIVNAAHDGTYDKTGLPDPLVLTNHSPYATARSPRC